MKDKITIVIPAYNSEQWLPRCLDSIINQTYSNLEIIVVDDGSKDNTASVIMSYAEKDTRIVPVLKSNGGVTSARIAGIEKATGDWIGFVDSDDEVEPCMYEFLINNAFKYDAQISHCGYSAIHSDGRKVDFHNTGKILYQNSDEAICELLSGNIVEPGLCNKLFRKDLFYKSNFKEKLDKSIIINEDLLFNYLLFSTAKKIIYEDKCPYHYMSREGSASRQMNEHSLLDPIKVKKYILDDANTNVFNQAKNSYIATCVNSYNSIIYMKDKKYKTIFSNIRKDLLKNRSVLKNVNVHTRILAYMIIYIPHIYPLIYNFYVKHFQKNKYY